MPLSSSVHAHLLTILEKLITLQTPSTAIGGKRCYSSLFQELPDHLQYPDYYLVIKEPRSLNGILASLKNASYSSPGAVAYDLFLVWNNARQYNQEGSIVYADAHKLETCMQDLWNGRTPPLPPFHSLMRPGSLPLQSSTKKHKSKHDRADKHARGEKHERSEKHRDGSSKKAKRDKDRPSSSSAIQPALLPSTPSGVFSTPSTTRIAIKPIMLHSTPIATPISTANATQMSTPSSTTSISINPFKIKIPSKLSISSTPRITIPASPAPTTLFPMSIAPMATLNQASVASFSALPLPSTPLIGIVSLKRSTPAAPIPALYTLQSVVPYASSPASSSTGVDGGPKKELRKDRRAREKLEKEHMRLLRESGSGPSAIGDDGLEIDSLTGPADYQGIADVQTGWFGGDFGRRSPREVYLDIINQLKSKKDTAGRLLATPLISAPDRASRPDYYKLVSEPISLDIIQANVEQNLYPLPRNFDEALHRLFTIAKIFIRPETPGSAWSDLLLIQQLYQKITKWTQASEFIPPIVSNGLGLNKITIPASSASSTLAERPPILAMGLDGTMVDTGRRDLRDRVFLDGINLKGDVYRVGDWVHVANPENAARPIVVQIFKVWKKVESNQRGITACWYLRPEETTHAATRQFYESEVFKTNNYIDHYVEDVLERCFVMPYYRYIRGRPISTVFNSKMALYVCEHRYKPKEKSFKKIKSWAMCGPEEVRKSDYRLKENAGGAVESLVKVPSPFIRGLQGPGGIGAADEEEEADQATYYLKADKGKVAAKTEQPNLIEDHSMLYDGSFNLNGQGTPISQLTPAELASMLEAFEPLPVALSSQFRTDDDGDLLWFTAPPITLPQPKKQVSHSLEYLYWKATKTKRFGGGMSNKGSVDVEMA